MEKSPPIPPACASSLSMARTVNLAGHSRTPMSSIMTSPKPMNLEEVRNLNRSQQSSKLYASIESKKNSRIDDFARKFVQKLSPKAADIAPG